MEETTRAYLAGLFDGDGHFGVHVQRKMCVPRIVLRINQKDQIVRVLDDFGYDESAVWSGPSGRLSTRTLYGAWFEGFGIVPSVSKALLPYLRVKKRQAELLLDLCDVRAEYGTTRTYVTGTYQRTLSNGTVVTANSKGYPPELYQRMEAIRQEIMRLNHE